MQVGHSRRATDSRVRSSDFSFTSLWRAGPQAGHEYRRQVVGQIRKLSKSKRRSSGLIPLGVSVRERRSLSHVRGKSELLWVVDPEDTRGRRELGDCSQNPMGDDRPLAEAEEREEGKLYLILPKESRLGRSRGREAEVVLTHWSSRKGHHCVRRRRCRLDPLSVVLDGAPGASP